MCVVHLSIIYFFFFKIFHIWNFFIWKLLTNKYERRGKRSVTVKLIFWLCVCVSRYISLHHHHTTIYQQPTTTTNNCQLIVKQKKIRKRKKKRIIIIIVVGRHRRRRHYYLQPPRAPPRSNIYIFFLIKILNR